MLIKVFAAKIVRYATYHAEEDAKRREVEKKESTGWLRCSQADFRCRRCR